MENQKYNGYTNYETWCVNLWLDNEQGSQEYWLDAARSAQDDARFSEQVESKIWTEEDAAKFLLANRLKKEITSQVPQLVGMFTDLLNGALSEVNWNEIAQHLIDAL